MNLVETSVSDVRLASFHGATKAVQANSFVCKDSKCAQAVRVPPISVGCRYAHVCRFSLIPLAVCSGDESAFACLFASA